MAMGKQIAKKSLIILLAVVCILLTLKGCTMWTFKTELMRDIKPYGGGDLRIINDDLYVMQYVSPPYVFKVDAEGMPTGGYTEEWMHDPAEMSMRGTVRILKGSFEEDVQPIFEERGEDGSWWLSPDGQTIYVTTEWFNEGERAGVTVNEYIDLTYYAVYKSTDGGKRFSQLAWPEHQRITRIMFTPNGQQGYIVGGGPSLWRTNDGAQTWQAITIPNAIYSQRIAGQASENFDKDITAFDAYHLDSEGTLWVANEMHTSLFNKYVTALYALPWDEQITDMNVLKPTLFPDTHFASIESDGSGGVYVMTKVYDFAKNYPHSSEVDYGFMHINQNKILVNKEFGKRDRLYKLYVGNGLLYIVGAENGDIAGDDVALISRDGGVSWDRQDEGRKASAGYFDPQNNIAWAYKTYSLYYRKL